MSSPKVWVAMLLRDVLSVDDDVLTGGMMLLGDGERSRLIGCLGTARLRWKVGDAMQTGELVPEDCQTTEVRYVQSSDQAVSGDEIT